LPEQTEADEMLDIKVLETLTEALSRRFRANGPAPAKFNHTTHLLEVGLLDSQGLLDLILEVEEGCGRAFDPDRVDFADGLTLGKLANAFI
jgi:hypothetical protein